MAFPGTTATGASVTASLSAVAPSVPGVYTLQRAMQKNGVAYGDPSTAASITVLGAPSCTAVTTDVGSTFNPSAILTANLAGSSSVEGAAIRVWGDAQGEANGADYTMTFTGGKWVAPFPIANHLTPGETRLNIRASVSNEMFPPAVCATTSVTYVQLPLPSVTLVPTFGSFGDASRLGYVVNQAGGDFAKITIDLGAFNSTLKARVEVLDASNNNIISPLNSVTGGQMTTVNLSSTVLNAISAAWLPLDATVRVSYSDSGAANQGKEVSFPISWMAAPGNLTVSASGTNAETPTVTSALVHPAHTFSTTTSGDFIGYVRSTVTQIAVGASQSVSETGTWLVGNLDYGQLYATPLQAVARAVPPAGVTLLAPLEFTSPAFNLPAQAPSTLTATDGTRENDVLVEWNAAATGSSIRYRVFRDATEITPITGISGLNLVDVPPVRGVTYNYSAKTMINGALSQGAASDDGFVPACRAARLIGASIDANMSALNGLVEKWDCLETLSGSGQINSLASSEIVFGGANSRYRKFTFPIPESLADGSHNLRATIESPGVSIHSTRTYDIPFVVDRASITVKNLSIQYDGANAQNGLEATSIGRFGVKMDGGSGIGFAEEMK